MASGLAGYNFYRDGVLLNPDYVTQGTWGLHGLPPATNVGGITATAVDRTGNESDPSDPLSANTAGAPTPDFDMAPADVAAVEAIINGVPASGGSTGSMFAISGPKGSYVKAFGTCDGTNPMTTDMHFRIASLTKTFTAALVLMQVDRGKMRLDDPIGKYISNMPNGSTCTIRNLLTMRSGLFHDQSDTDEIARYYTNPSAAWNEASALLVIRRGPVQAVPGTTWDYTNTNYLVLGIILQRVTGKTFNNLLADEIFTPLGMTNSLYPTTTTLPEPYTHAYGPGATGSIMEWTIQNPEFMGAAGAIVSTIRDLVTWGKELRDGKLLSPASHALRTSPDQLLEIPDTTERYGLGMFQVGSWYGHPGGEPGWCTTCAFHPPSGMVIAGMENGSTVQGANAITCWSITFPAIAEYFYPGSTGTV